MPKIALGGWRRLWIVLSAVWLVVVVVFTRFTTILLSFPRT